MVAVDIDVIGDLSKSNNPFVTKDKKTKEEVDEAGESLTKRRTSSWMRWSFCARR